MAASVSAWSKPGNWALESEKEELTQSHLHPPAPDFPSLSVSATTKTTKKKKKPQTLSLAEFSAKSDPPISLPTAPRDRTAEELDQTRGFRSYGADSSSRWGGGDEGRRSARSPPRESGPSRADESGDWGAGKRSTAGNGFERRERGGFFDSQSRGNESERWVSGKGSRFGGFDREAGFNGGGADSGAWGRKREDVADIGIAPMSSGNGRPRLVLQPRTLPVVSPVVVSAVSPVSNEKVVEAPVIVARPKGLNPFGQARPREEVLAEKGQDWKEIDEKLEATKIKEVAEKVERGDRSGFSAGRRGFGNGNGRAGLQEERRWRKPETGNGSRPGSAERADNGVSEENGRGNDEQVTEG